MKQISKVARERAFLLRYEKIIHKIRAWVLNTKDVNAALKYANLYGEIRTFNHDGIYADDKIEQYIESLAMNSGRIDSHFISAARGEGVLVLATSLYDHGGHTKVLMTWLKLLKEVLPHKLVITESATFRADKKLADMAIDTIKLSCTGLDALVAIMDAAKGCNRIVMLTHPEDIVSAVAARILAASGYHVIFYNHADHVFSYGLGAAQTVCEISAYGEAINQRTNRIKGASVRLGVPLKGTDLMVVSLPENMHFMDGCKVLLSVGTPYKFKPNETFIFADFIDAILLRRDDVKVALVGPTGKEDWWETRRKKWNDRVLFLGLLPHPEYMKLLKRANIYVDSYPVTGGTAFPEALLAGKACIGLITPVQGYSLADELKVESPDELVQQAEKILDSDLETMLHIQKLRERVANTQSECAFKARILEIYRGDIPLEQNQNNGLQKGLDSYWLEEKWRASGLITKPRNKTMMRLTFHCGIQILLPMLLNNFLARRAILEHAK